jgi:hypothetical protein
MVTCPAGRVKGERSPHDHLPGASGGEYHAAMKLYLHFRSGVWAEKVLELDVPDGETRFLGRDPGSDVCFDAWGDASVSRDHATLTNEGGRIVLRDVGAKLGTFVGGKRVGRVELRSKDRVQLGEGGPLFRFYRGVDLKKCPLCRGPLFKNNFTCIGCRRKVCFHHFDARFACCADCALERARLTGHDARAARQPCPECEAPLGEGSFVCYRCTRTLCPSHFDDRTKLCRACAAGA